MKKISVFHIFSIKKTVIGLVIIVSVSIFACERVKDFFTLGSVKAVKSESLEELEKRAMEYETNTNKETGAGDKLAIIYQKIGDKYLERKTWTSAINAYEKAIGYGRDSSIVHYSIAVAYANRGKELQDKSDINKAEYQYKRAIEISPDNYDARYGLGILYAYLKNDKAKGLKIFKVLIALNDKYYSARFAVGRIYYELGEKKISLSIYEDLYSDLQKQKKSPQMEEYLKNCKINIERLMTELAGSK